MSFQRGEIGPREHIPLDYRMPHPTTPWAVAAFTLAIVALLSMRVDLVIPLFASSLAILCGAVAITVVLVERRVHGLWMALLAIITAALPLVLSALVLFDR